MKLIEEMPNLAMEIEAGLTEINEELLSKSVKELKIIGRCKCGDKNCGTFYTLEKEKWLGKGLHQVIPTVENLYAIDVFNNKIVCIEILDRKDVTNKLNELFQ